MNIRRMQIARANTGKAQRPRGPPARHRPGALDAVLPGVGEHWIARQPTSKVCPELRRRVVTVGGAAGAGGEGAGGGERCKMKRAEAESTIRHLVHLWARGTGIAPGSDEQPSFFDFRRWMEEEGYSGYFSFRST